MAFKDLGGWNARERGLDAIFYGFCAFSAIAIVAAVAAIFGAPLHLNPAITIIHIITGPISWGFLTVVICGIQNLLVLVWKFRGSRRQ